ncbi:MAG: hypothetical protein HGB00_07105 [Chlorobiaceae bacterium]|nr:hypothetical protein [Chlorobiaceae bacterium]
MDFMKDMQPYELLLMGMGVLLFLVTLVLMVIQSAKSGISKGLIGFFILSIIMVGFPAITSFNLLGFSFSKLRREAARVESGTASSEDVAAFRKSLAEAEKSGKKITDPALLTSIAKASYQIGDIQATRAFAEQALAIDSTFQPALAVKSLTVKHDSITAALKNGLQRVSAPEASAKDSTALRMTIEQLGSSKVLLSDPALLERTAEFEKRTGNGSSAASLFQQSKRLQLIKTR